MPPLIIANWKMNFLFEDAIEFCTNLSNQHNDKLIICPPTPYLAYLTSQFPNIRFGSQNVSAYKDFGAYTGEYSALMLKSCKVKYALIGHSERRNLLGETDKIVLQKAANCLKAGITPIICIGEPLDVRKNGGYKKFLLKQLTSFISSIQPNAVTAEIIIAYEPLWSIGTGIMPPSEQLLETFEIINSYLKQRQVANNVRLVYGGSVNLSNIEKTLSLEHINGCLIGKTSLEYQALTQILERTY